MPLPLGLSDVTLTIEVRQQSAVLVFARAPVAGACKTRLEPALGAYGCAALQRLLVEHTVREASTSGAECVQLWCTPDTTHAFFVRLAAQYGIELVTQRGADLGERMHLALTHGLVAAKHALLIGTDCPAQDAPRIRKALAAMRAGADLVLRPARDGGYVGVGLAKPSPSLFKDTEWGADTVMRSTRKAAHLAGLKHTELSALDDLDTPKDLAKLSDAWRARIGALDGKFAKLMRLL